MSTTYPTATDEERETAIEAAAQAVQRGGLVVLPTDTVYGIGADAFDHAAVQALLDAKGRGRDMPPPVLISAATTLDALATSVQPYVEALTEAFWPGPLTLVCDAAAVAAVGPRRHPRHGRGADARPRGRPGAARAHRPARGQLGQPQRPAGRDRGRRGRGDARRQRRGGARRRSVAEGEASTILDVSGARSRGCSARARSRSTALNEVLSRSAAP